MKTLHQSLFKILISGILFFVISSCKDQLTDINKNPNAVETPQPSYLLTAGIKSATDTYWEVSESNPANLLIQYWAAYHYTDPDRYIFTSNSFQPLWSGLYAKSIINLDKAIETAEKQNKPNLKAASLVIRSWAYCLLTDAFGAIPYSEAMNINQYVAPKYDTQKEVYEGLLADLKKAYNTFDVNGEPIKGDIIYDGSVSLWKKFANSLRLRIALRMADRDPEKAKEVMSNIKNSGGKYISNNSEIADLDYQTAPNNNPISEQFLSRDDYRISATIVQKLKQLNDPRLPIYADSTTDVHAATYVGIPNGLLNGNASNYGATATSKPGKYFTGPHSPAVIISYAEVLFDRAEAAARNLSNEDAENLYLAAIEASLKQYGISQNAINDYLAQSAIAYDPNNYRKSIGIQKWIALYGQGLEAFAEWRRLDYPQLSPAAAGVLEGKMPERYVYPGTEQSLNKKSYQAAIAHQGPDLLTTQLWFDVD